MIGKDWVEIGAALDGQRSSAVSFHHYVLNVAEQRHGEKGRGGRCHQLPLEHDGTTLGYDGPAYDLNLKDQVQGHT